MIKKLLNILIYVLSPFWQYYKYFTLNRVLSIKKITKDGVHIIDQPIKHDRLYVIKLESQYDRFISFELGNLKKVARHEEMSQINYFFVKKNEYQMGYIATFSKNIALEIMDSMGLKLCSVSETVKFLLDLYLINNYSLDTLNQLLKPSVDISALDASSLFDPLRYNFSTILKDGAYLQNEQYDMYQVIKMQNKKSFNYKNSFREDFNGLFAMYIDLSDKGLEFRVDDYLAYSKRTDKKIAPEMAKLKDMQKMGKLDALIVNSIIICDDEREAYNTAGNLGLEIVKKDGLDKLSILKKSFLMTRELDYDCVVPTTNINNIVGIRTKKNLTKNDVNKLSKGWTDVKVDFYGKNIYNAFVNYCFRANENPHAVLIADTGTGKSVALQKILSSVLRIDYKKLTIDRWSEVKTRYFEIGGSSALLQQMLKRLYPNDVGLIEGSLENMKFSMIDVKTTEVLGETKVDKDSLSLSIQLLNVVLKENNEIPLTATEQTLYEKAIIKLYKEKLYKNKTISLLRRISPEAYKIYLDKFDEKGYVGTTRISEITDCGNLDNLMKPTLDDLISLLQEVSSSASLSNPEREAYHTLILKVTAVGGIEGELFGSLNSLALDDKAFYSFEFNKITKNKSLLRTVFSFLFVQIYQQDVAIALKRKAEGKKMKQTLYIFEEARNFIEDNEEIVKLLKSAVFEGRKFQIQAFFVAQLISHLPRDILVGVSSFFFLVPEIKDKREILKQDILKIYNTEAVRYLLDNIEFRMLGIISSQGVYSCKLELTKEELETFAV